MNDSLVYFVDDDPEVLGTIMSMAEAIGVRSMGFGSGDEFLEKLPSLEESPVFLDVRMRGLDGLETLRQIRQHWHLVPVIMISGSSDIAMAVKAMRLGATDFVEKPISIASLEKSIREAESYKSVAATTDQFPAARSRLLNLTHREMQVSRLLVNGIPNRQIGDQLGISPRTVEIHRANSLKKMEVQTFAEFVKACVAGKIDDL